MQPLSAAEIPSVYALLEAAVGHDATSRGAAEAGLANYETRVGFCSCLLEIVSAPELQHKPEPRWLAAVYFKNSINRYWRARREALGISDAEKPHLRAKLLQLIGESSPQVALQLALLTAKIARIDFPKDWPELLGGLCGRLRPPPSGTPTADLLLSQRAALFLHHVLKELSTKRLIADQRNLAQAAASLWDPVWALWLEDTGTLVNGLPSLLGRLHQHQEQQQQRQQQQASGTPGAGVAQAGGSGASVLGPEEQGVLALTCERWTLALKLLRRMLLFGHQSDFKSVQEVGAVKQVSAPFLEAAKAFLGLWAQAQGCGPGGGQSPDPAAVAISEFLRSALLRLMRTATQMLETHPYSLAAGGALRPMLEFAFEQTVSDPSASHTAGEHVAEAASRTSVPLDGFEPFQIHCMLYLQEALKCVAYKQARTGRVVGAAEDVLPSMADARGRMADVGQQELGAFFDAPRVVGLAQVLVQRFMVLSARDLEAWAEDPEGFFHEQDAIQWREKLRPCAEALYLLLFENFKEVVTPVVLDIVGRAMRACPPPSSLDDPVAVTPVLLHKEAAYDAVGAASYDLHDYVDLETWYSGTLAAELANRHPNGKILRRKVAWLLGQWVSKIKKSMRRPVYAALVPLLADQDTVVKLATCGAIRALVDDVSFYEEEFLEFAETCLSHLFTTLHSVSAFDSQLLVVNVISLVIERIGERVMPFADKILGHLPLIWERSEGESLLRIQVLLMLQRLVVALGPESPRCYSVLLPILQHCTDIQQPDELNMLEDGLHLWSTSLRHSPAMVPPFMDLFPHLVPVLERNFDHLLVAVRIMESYVLLGASEFLQGHAGRVVHMLGLLVGQVKERAMLPVLGLVDLLVQCYPSEAPQALEAILQRCLVIQVGPTEYSALVRGMAATVLARVVLLNSAFFSAFISGPALQQQLAANCGDNDRQRAAASSPGGPFLLFLDSWLELVDSVSVEAKRKLSALALCNLLATEDPRVLERLDQVMSVCSSVVSSGAPAMEQTSVGHDFLGTSATDEFLGSSVECEYSRRLQVAGSDVVNCADVIGFVKEKLQTCQQIHGSAAVQSALSRLHGSMLSALHLTT